MTIDRRRFLGRGAAIAAAAAWPGGALLASSPDAAPDPMSSIDPELRAAARQLVASGNLSLSDGALAALRQEGRAAAEPLLTAMAVEERRVFGGPGLREVTVFVVNGGRDGARPGILHTHGGGHVLGSARSELRYLQALARELDCIVVSVEYRLAPETPYTGSTEDTYSALLWMHGAASELGLDTARIALLGESAGGTHAALLAIAARDRGEVPVAFQALVYPMLDDRTGSTRHPPPWIGALLWDAAANRYGWRAFLGAEPGGPGVPAKGVPARIADLAGLPPAWIGVGGADLFVEEDMDYAARLTEAGVATELLLVPRAFHAFDRIAPDTHIARRFTEAKMSALRRAFAALEAASAAPVKP